MTARATFTEAQLARAIRVAEKTGKVAKLTTDGIVFLDPSAVPQGAKQESAVDGWFRENGDDPG